MRRQYRQFKAIQIAARLLPRRVMYWVGDRAARVYFDSDARARNAVAGNLRRIHAFKGCEPVAAEIDRLSLMVFRGVQRGVDVIHLGNAASGSLRALRQGRIVAILADIDYTQRDDRTLFMGGEARLPIGPARLSIKTGAPVVPFFVSRLSDRRYSLRFCPPIVPTAGTSLEAIREQIVKVLEEAILENPHLWILFFDFWDCELSLDLARKGFAVLEQSGKKRDLTAV